MENASKALIMAAGILIGVLVLALMTTLIISARELFIRYDNEKKMEAVEQFNVNFLKYVGEDLTIYQAITITNFAKAHGLEPIGGITTLHINQESIKNVYHLEILHYTEEGYIDQIRIK